MRPESNTTSFHLVLLQMTLPGNRQREPEGRPRTRWLDLRTRIVDVGDDETKTGRSQVVLGFSHVEEILEILHGMQGAYIGGLEDTRCLRPLAIDRRPYP